MQRVDLFDATPSVKNAGKVCKRVLWGLVEWLCEGERQQQAWLLESTKKRHEEERKLQEDEQMAALHKDLSEAGLLDSLPLEFGQTKKRRRASDGARAPSSGTSADPCKALGYQYNALFQTTASSELEEHNVYLVKHAEDGRFYPAHLLGLGPRSDPGAARFTSMVRFLGYSELIEVDRNASWIQPVLRNKHALVAALLQEHEKVRYDVPCPTDSVHAKYWDQRYRLFSKFDEGVELDQESWYSVTPESIADHISEKCLSRALASKTRVATVLDCFSGCGGNTVSLAKYFPSVIAVDVVAEKLAMTRRNAAVYEVRGAIELVCADVYSVLQGLPAIRPLWTGDSNFAAPPADVCLPGAAMVAPAVDLMLMSPPWGGPEYLQAHIFDLAALPCGDGVHLLALAASRCANVVYLLPRNTDAAQLRTLADSLGLPAQVEELHLHHKHKITVLYLGPLFE